MIRNRLATVGLAVLLLGATAPSSVGAATSASTSTSDVTLTVNVTDAFNNPLDGVTVTATWDGGSTADETRSNGQVLIDVPEGATVELTFSHRAYTRNNPLVVEDASGEQVSATVYRKADAEIAVTNAKGNPIDDAQVVLSKSGTEAVRGRTNGDGVFESGTIEKGDYQVTVVKEGFYGNETTLAVEGSVGTTVTLSEGSVTMTIAVADSHFDPAESIEGATVQISDVGTVTTGSSGEQTIAVPVNSNVSLSITKDDYTTTTKTISVGERSREVTVTITREDSLTVTPGNDKVVAGERVRLTVRNEYGEAVEGATIAVDGESVGSTDADGVFHATLSEAGSHEIVAQKDGVSSPTVTVEAVEPASDETPTAPSADEETATPSPSPTSDEIVPGFGFAAALLALFGLLFVAGRRR